MTDLDDSPAQADAAAELMARANAVARAAGEAELMRAASCVAVGITEMLASGRDPRLRRIADALAADPGPDAVTGSDVPAAPPAALAANAFLMHAQLADDSYRLAEHPGLAVLPIALAVPAAGPTTDADAWLRAVAGGYEAAGVLADLLLPEASARGFRVTAAVAPVATAATAALLDGGGESWGADAIRIAAAASGGSLGVFGDGDAWRVQPALASVPGLLAARAARAGARGDPCALDGEHGMLAVLAGRSYTGIPAGPPRIGRVMFKRHPVPMYGQAVFDALTGAGARVAGATALRVRVPPFAAAYGDQRPGAVTSIAAITRAALERIDPAVAGRISIAVTGDPRLGLHDAVIEVGATTRRPAAILTGSGDTSGWSPDDVARHCAARIGPSGERIAAAARAAATGGPLAPLQETWRAVR
jgi:2-methylcitrate dehydratase PrpD